MQAPAYAAPQSAFRLRYRENRGKKNALEESVTQEKSPANTVACTMPARSSGSGPLPCPRPLISAFISPGMPAIGLPIHLAILAHAGRLTWQAAIPPRFGVRQAEVKLGVPLGNLVERIFGHGLPAS